MSRYPSLEREAGLEREKEIKRNSHVVPNFELPSFIQCCHVSFERERGAGNRSPTRTIINHSRANNEYSSFRGISGHY
jgi:hypothetical protein